MQFQNDRNKKFNPLGIAVFIFFVLVGINPVLGIAFAIIAIAVSVLSINKSKGGKTFSFFDYLQIMTKTDRNLSENSNLTLNQINEIDYNKDENGEDEISLKEIDLGMSLPPEIKTPLPRQTKLEKRKKYLHIALNNSLEEAREIIQKLPTSDRILIEVGTPLIKIYGTDAIYQIRNMAAPGTYIVADNKCADLASREVEMMAIAGANASTCLGVAPIETIDNFIEECQKFNIDSMIDMMNVEDALSVLKKLKKLPNVVMLHRGVDETESSKGKQIPFYQIKQIKGNYNILVAVAGGDTIKEIQSAIFNNADIVVVWKNFYQISSDTTQLAKSFLKEIQ